MRMPARIRPHLTVDELGMWVEDAPDRDTYRRRLAIWMTECGPYHAQQVAMLLQVSVGSVWRWVAQYNGDGPEGLERQGRGGRRWALLSWAEEEQMLKQWHARAREADVLTAEHLHGHICQRTGHQVSLGYVYKLLARHGWRKLAPRPRHTKSTPQDQEAYKKTPRPHRANTR